MNKEYDKCRKIEKVPERFEYETVVSSSSENDINVMKDLNSFKIDQPYTVYSLNKKMGSLEKS
jgi:hypothetical protein